MSNGEAIRVIVVVAVVSMAKRFWQYVEYVMLALQFLVTSSVLLSILSRSKPRSVKAEVFPRPWPSLSLLWGLQSCGGKVEEVVFYGIRGGSWPRSSSGEAEFVPRLKTASGEA
jgi:hypothetical protein